MMSQYFHGYGGTTCDIGSKMNPASGKFGSVNQDELIKRWYNAVSRPASSIGRATDS